MDKLFITDLEVYGFHSVEPDTDKSGEKYIISAELSLNLKEAGDTDRFEDTVHLVKLCNEMSDVFTHNTHKQIERSAEEIATYILLHYPIVYHVAISIKKPWIQAGLTIDHTGIRIERQWHTVFLGVGSNLGDRMKHIRAAADLINSTEFTTITRTSQIYETEPHGYLEQEMFLNCVFEIQTLLTPRSLVSLLLDIEKKLKRQRKIHLGPRTIDLDILFYDNVITSFEEAVIPHPRLHERRFVLKPLCDIAPYLVHPILNERCYRIADALGSDESEPGVWPERL
jgi:dihydroneopterin aldolase/2-amino-4-hydroxy-6-hydroxymethyldihydropteridine diphosphokinase